MWEQIQSCLGKFWRWLIVIWGSSYTLFVKVFEPDRAWVAIWRVFVLSFFTKMLELAYDEETERLSYKAWRSRFSSATALFKAFFKVAIYLVLMLLLAEGRSVYSQGVSHQARSVVTSLVFTIECLNNLKHLSTLPALSGYVKAISKAVKQIVLPKGIDEDDLDL